MEGTKWGLVGVGLAAITLWLLSRREAEAAPPKEGFSLKITNPPSEATQWWANLGEATGDYSIPAISGLLSIDEAWVFPEDPRGCNTLHVRIVNERAQLLIDTEYLGPLFADTSYVFDASTRMLYEEK